MWLWVGIIRWCDSHATISEEVLSGGVQKDSGGESSGQQLLQIRQPRAAAVHVVSVPGGANGNVLSVVYDSEDGEKVHHVGSRLLVPRRSCI